MPELTQASHDLRATRVGASEVGAILGVDPFRGAMTVWERLTMGKETAPSERMRLGSALEVPIARFWAKENGERVRLNRLTHVRGHLAATADGFTRGGLLEVKFSSYSDAWGQGLPEHIYWQCVAQSWVWRGPQRRRVTVAALVEGKMRTHTVEPTRAERLWVRDAVDRFWRLYIETGEVPIPMYPHELLTYLHLLQGTDPEARRAATMAEQLLAERYLAIRTSLRAYETEAEAARSALLQEISGAPIPRIAGDGWTYTIAPDGRITIAATKAAGGKTDGKE